MSAKRKKESDQPELPIEGAIPAPVEKESPARILKPQFTWF
jgi:hypothetical protein